MVLFKGKASRSVRIRSAEKTGSTRSSLGYTERNKNLRFLGFSSYQDYLKSDLWKEVRRLAFQKHGHKCVACDNPATELHHSSYCLKTLAGSRLSQIHPVCRACHESAEILDGIKRHRQQANRCLGVRGRSYLSERRTRKKMERTERAQQELDLLSKKTLRAIKQQLGRRPPKDQITAVAAQYGISVNAARLASGRRVR